jgi:hypothetical protein
MKKSTLFIAAACALIISAQASTVHANSACTPFKDYCENWVGTWSIVSNHGTDNVTFEKVCFDNTSCVTNTVSAGIYCCQTKGKRQSDNKTIMVAGVSMDTTAFGYYELAKDNTTVDQNSPYNRINVDTINLICDTFKGSPDLNSVDNFGLKSGKKIGSPDNCTDNCTGDNCTTDNCTLTTVPKKIFKLLSFLNPFSGIVIIGDDKTDFTRGIKPDWDTTAIINLLPVKIGKKIIVDIVFINPLSKDTGEKDFTVGEYCGTIEIK